MTSATLLLALAMAAQPDQGADPSADAPAAASLCVECHGLDGRSRTVAAPHIGGQNELYLIWAMTQYREGRREGDVMSTVASTLSSDDVEQLARWYAAQRWPAEQHDE
jgi:cytochrome c553